MPAQAFADMWTTLKAGRSWTALVKNRRKNGDHYWVRANATPIVRNGQTTGYMSVRTKPRRDEVAQAEELYRAFRENRMVGRAFHQGLIVRTGLLSWMSLLQTLPVRWRMRLPLCFSLALSLAAAWACGLTGSSLAILATFMCAIDLTAMLWFENQISRPLENVLKQALSVASGQPGENLNLNRVDEIGMILRAVNQSGLNLRSIVDDVVGQASGLRMASSEIVRGNIDLSSRTEQAASSLQQTAASMEEMTDTVSNSAESAHHATQFAATVSNAATKGGAVVTQVVETMQDISAASKKITDIIGVIDGIAFQTNILALNAAVEAARAGEQGRGFAVVAGEVRSLAQRSAEAAREIKRLIGASTEKVEVGALLVEQAGQAMSEIVSQVRRVTTLINEISASSVEQSSGIGQVNIAVAQLDQMTQQNATLVDQSATSAQSLQSRADRLLEAVAVFGLNSDRGGL
jgi:aerotaxis receptor